VGISAEGGDLLGAPGLSSAGSANEKVRLGLIGRAVGGTSFWIPSWPRKRLDLVAVTDVDDRHAGETAERIKKGKRDPPTGPRGITERCWTARMSTR